MNKLKTLEEKSKSIYSASSKIRKFLDSILDEKSFVETDVFMSGNSFINGEEALGEGVVTGYASIADVPVYLFAQNQEILSGSLGKAHADKIIKVINQALKNDSPIIAVIDSNGARIGEGVAVLEAYSAVINALTVASYDVPVISIVKGNCVGLMSVIPAISDYVFVSDQAVISLTPPAVAQAKGNSTLKLTEILGATAHTSMSGLGHYVFKNAKDIIKPLKAIIGEQSSNDDDANRISPSLNKEINVKAIINAVADNKEFLAYSEGYAKEIVCGYSSINGINCGLAICDSSVSHSLTRQGIDKLVRFVEFCDKFNMPFISFVDCNGISSSLTDEQGGIARDLALLMKTISTSSNAKVSVIIGKAIGAAYSVLASKSIGFDYAFAFANAEITPIDPAVAVQLVYADDLKKADDPQKARVEIEAQYASMAGNPIIAAKDGYIDNIIEPSNLRPYLASVLIMLLGL